MATNAAKLLSCLSLTQWQCTKLPVVTGVADVPIVDRRSGHNSFLEQSNIVPTFFHHTRRNESPLYITSAQSLSPVSRSSVSSLIPRGIAYSSDIFTTVTLLITPFPIDRGTGYCFRSISLFVYMYLSFFLSFFVSLL